MAALIEPSLAAALDRKMALRGKVEYTPSDVSLIAEQLNRFLMNCIVKETNKNIGALLQKKNVLHFFTIS